MRSVEPMHTGSRRSSIAVALSLAVAQSASVIGFIPVVPKVPFRRSAEAISVANVAWTTFTTPI
jgi:hypothetical protein